MKFEFSPAEGARAKPSVSDRTVQTPQEPGHSCGYVQWICLGCVVYKSFLLTA